MPAIGAIQRKVANTKSRSSYGTLIDPFSARESQIFNDYIDGFSEFIGDNVTAVGGHKATPLRWHVIDNHPL